MNMIIHQFFKGLGALQCKSIEKLVTTGIRLSDCQDIDNIICITSRASINLQFFDEAKLSRYIFMDESNDDSSSWTRCEASGL